jgi:hypothetical protein
LILKRAGTRGAGKGFGSKPGFLLQGFFNPSFAYQTLSPIEVAAAKVLEQ